MDNLIYIKHPSLNDFGKIISSCDYLINVFEDKFYKVGNEQSNYMEYLSANQKQKLKRFPLYSYIHGSTLNNFFNAVGFILKNRDKKIIIHCRSGKHRSKMVYDAVYFLEKGKHNPKDNMLITNCENEYNFFRISLEEMEDKLISLK